MRRIYGIILMVTASILSAIETEHFGNNLFPATRSELACDIALVILFVYGFFLFMPKRYM